MKSQSQTIQKLKNRGLTPAGSKSGAIVMKSPTSVILCHKDGEFEGFMRTNTKPENEQKIDEVTLKQLVALSVLISSSLMYFTTDVTIVYGKSMEPTYKNLSVLIRTKAKTKVEGNLAEGMVVNFISPGGQKTMKRIVAIPGDTLEFFGVQVWRNGKRIDSDNSMGAQFGTDQKVYAPLSGREVHGVKRTILKLKPHEYFVMGDNRIKSADSRTYGPIHDTAILSIIDK
jgi:signal peptidase I